MQLISHGSSSPLLSSITGSKFPFFCRPTLHPPTCNHYTWHRRCCGSSSSSKRTLLFERVMGTLAVFALSGIMHEICTATTLRIFSSRRTGKAYLLLSIIICFTQQPSKLLHHLAWRTQCPEIVREPSLSSWASSFSSNALLVLFLTVFPPYRVREGVRL
jgi:hypothetical protein